MPRDTNVPAVIDEPIETVNRLTKDVPPGEWVVIAPKRERLIAHGDCVADLVKQAREAGETDLYVGRVPSEKHVNILV